MDFGERFRTLREQKGLSEDQIASYFGITWKEVSAMEKGKSEPSLAMLVKIAAYFGVTTDSLLGADRVLEETMTAGYLERYHAHIAANRLPEAIEVMREGLLHFPNNDRLKCMLLYALYLSCTRPAVTKHYSPEILSLGEEILSSCTDDALRLEARRVLCLHYCDDLSDPERAAEIARALPSRQSSREEMLPHILQGEKKADAIRQNIHAYSTLLTESILQLVSSADDLSKEEKEQAVRTAVKLLELLYPGENGEGEVSLSTMTLYKELGILALREGMIDDAFRFLEKAARLAVEYDSLPENSFCRSPLMKGLPISKKVFPAVKGDEPDGAVRSMLGALRIFDAMEALRYDKRLEGILAILTEKEG